MIIVSGENEGNANVLKTELLLVFFFFSNQWDCCRSSGSYGIVSGGHQ